MPRGACKIRLFLSITVGPYKRVLEGVTYASDGVRLIPHNEVTRWIEQQILALRAGPFRTPSGP